MTKKLLSLFLPFVMVIGMLPMTALAKHGDHDGDTFSADWTNTSTI